MAAKTNPQQDASDMTRTVPAVSSPTPGQDASAMVGAINTTKPMTGPNDYLQEYGRIGQRRVAGFFFEEFITDLRGRKGIQVYTEMTNNDDVIGAVSTAIEMLMRQATWRIEPGGKKTTVDRKAAEFVNSCLHDMRETWAMTLADILSFISFGWSYHEICYKVRRGMNTQDPRYRSKFDDGLIGWQKLPIRAQDTLYQWQMNGFDDVLGMIQIPPPDYRWCTIPIEKALHFRTTSVKNSPEGRSMWRRAYRAWYFKKRIQEIEGVGIERDLAGFPVMVGPENVDLYDDQDENAKKQLAFATKIVTNIRRDQQEGLVLPHGWELKLLASQGRRAIDTNTTIRRYDTGIAMTGLADFMMLGHTKVGTFSLADSKTELFSLAMGAYLDMICETFNQQAIPRLMELNKTAFQGMTGYPEMAHGDLETPDLAALGTYIKDMTGCGALVPDKDLEDFLREVAGLPEANPDLAEGYGKQAGVPPAAAAMAAMLGQQPPGKPNPGKPNPGKPNPGKAQNAKDAKAQVTKPAATQGAGEDDVSAKAPPQDDGDDDEEDDDQGSAGAPKNVKTSPPKKDEKGKK